MSLGFITHSSAHSLPAHRVCTTHLHHCLSLTNWDVVKFFHLWVFHANSSWHKSSVGFITHSSACSLPAHQVCTTHLHHCLSLTNWDVVKNFHLQVFHANSSCHKSSVGFERQ